MYTQKDAYQEFTDAYVRSIDNQDIDSLTLLAQTAKVQGYDEDAEDIHDLIEELTAEYDPDRAPLLRANDVL